MKGQCFNLTGALVRNIELDPFCHTKPYSWYARSIFVASQVLSFRTGFANVSTPSPGMGPLILLDRPIDLMTHYPLIPFIRFMFFLQMGE